MHEINNIFLSHPVVYKNIVSAKGDYFFEDDGSAYLDFQSGIWCTQLGHGNERVNSAIKDQIDKVMHLNTRFISQITDETAGMLLEINNMQGGKAVFLSAGSEAVEMAYTISKIVSGKEKVFAFSNSFFSSYGSTGNHKTIDSFIKKDFLEYEKNPDEFFDGIDFSDTGAFLFEPGGTKGLSLFPDKNLVEETVKKIKENGGIIAVNEITAGMGRTGKFFGYMHYNITPDIIAIGKGLGNGYPVSCVLMNKKTADILKEKNFIYAQSHQNDPLGTRAAGEVVKIFMEENIPEIAAKKGKFFIEKLKELKSKHSWIKEIRGRGMMITLQVIPEVEVDRIFNELLNHNIYVGASALFNTISLMPPLTMAKENIEKFISVLDKINI